MTSQNSSFYKFIDGSYLNYFDNQIAKTQLITSCVLQKKYDEIDIIRFVMANQIHILPIQRATSYLGSLIKSNAGEIKYENYIQ